MLRKIVKTKRSNFVGVSEGNEVRVSKNLRRMRKMFLQNKIEAIQHKKIKEFPVVKIASYDEKVVEYSVYPFVFGEPMYNTWEGLYEDLKIIDRML